MFGLGAFEAHDLSEGRFVRRADANSHHRPGTDADVAHGGGDLIKSVSHGFQDGD
jgi:hypothetical protein